MPPVEETESETHFYLCAVHQTVANMTSIAPATGEPKQGEPVMPATLVDAHTRGKNTMKKTVITKRKQHTEGAKQILQFADDDPEFLAEGDRQMLLQLKVRYTSTFSASELQHWKQTLQTDTIGVHGALNDEDLPLDREALKDCWWSLFGQRPLTLGEGGFGLVMQVSKKAKWCVKVPTASSREIAKHELSVLERIFRSDADASTWRQPRGLVPTQVIRTQGGSSLIVMRKAKSSLFSYSLSHRQALQRNVRHFVEDMLDGLDFLHIDMGLAHCDLSVGNIIVDEGRVGHERGSLTFCLTDFGSTYPADTPYEKRLTGTTIYALSPEQMATHDPMNGCDVPIGSTDSDVWALGYLVYFLQTGKILFLDKSFDNSYTTTFIAQCKVIGMPDEWEGYSQHWHTMFPSHPAFRPFGSDGPCRPTTVGMEHHRTLTQAVIDVCIQRLPQRPRDARALLGALAPVLLHNGRRKMRRINK